MVSRTVIGAKLYCKSRWGEGIEGDRRRSILHHAHHGNRCYGSQKDAVSIVAGRINQSLDGGLADDRGERHTTRHALGDGHEIRFDARVLDREGRPVPGLLAAGADAGGIFTGGYGSGLAAALVFGRIAAETALS